MATEISTGVTVTEKQVIGIVQAMHQDTMSPMRRLLTVGDGAGVVRGAGHRTASAGDERGAELRRRTANVRACRPHLHLTALMTALHLRAHQTEAHRPRPTLLLRKTALRA